MSELLQYVLLLHNASLCFDSSLWLSLFIDHTSYRVDGSQPQLRVCNIHIFILIWRTTFTTVWECFLCLQTANLDTELLMMECREDTDGLCGSVVCLCWDSSLQCSPYTFCGVTLRSSSVKYSHSLSAATWSASRFHQLMVFKMSGYKKQYSFFLHSWLHVLL